MVVAMKTEGGYQVDKMIPRDSKRIAVSGKRQISIPKSFDEFLGIENEVTIELYGNRMIIKPVRDGFEDFSQEILSDLVDEGFTGKELKEEFKRRSERVQPAIRRMIDDALQGESYTHDEVFGNDDD